MWRRARGISANAFEGLPLGTISPGQAVLAASPSGKVLFGALAQHGFTLGQNLTMEAHGARGEVAKLPQLFQELKALNVDAKSAASANGRL